MVARFIDHVPGGTHDQLPSPTAAPVGALFACTTHNLIYKNDGSSAAWPTWAKMAPSDSDQAEFVRDTIGAALVAGANVTIAVDDPNNTITISSITDPEVVRDTIGAALVQGGYISVAVNDAQDTITLTLDTEGVQDMLATFIAGNSGVLATYDDPNNKLTLSLDVEYIQDMIASFFQNGTNTTVVYDDANNKIRIDATGGGGGSTTGPTSTIDAYSSAVMADAPWGFWKFAEASGTTLADASGNARNLTLTGSTATLAQAGVASSDKNAIAWANDTASYLRGPAAPADNSTTIGIWVKLAALPAANCTVYSEGDGSNGGSSNNDFGIELTTAGKVRYYSYGGTDYTCPDVLSLNVWHFVVARAGASQGATLRIDKKGYAAGSVGNGSARGIWVHGGVDHAGGAVLTGPLSVWGSYLSDRRVDAHYDAMMARPYSDQLAQDAVAGMLTAGPTSGITYSYDKTTGIFSSTVAPATPRASVVATVTITGSPNANTTATIPSGVGVGDFAVLLDGTQGGITADSNWTQIYLNTDGSASGYYGNKGTVLTRVVDSAYLSANKPGAGVTGGEGTVVMYLRAPAGYTMNLGTGSKTGAGRGNANMPAIPAGSIFGIFATTASTKPTLVAPPGYTGSYVTLNAGSYASVLLALYNSAVAAGTHPYDNTDAEQCFLVMPLTLVSQSTYQYTDEMAQDAIAALLAAGTHTGISFAYDDPNNKLSATVTGGGSGSGGSGGTPSSTRLRKSADQSIPANAWTAISWDIEDSDTLNAHDNATNNTRFTAPNAGLYLVDLHAPTTGTSDRYICLYKNGSAPVAPSGTSYSGPSGDANNRYFDHVQVVQLAAGDYIEAFTYSPSAFTLTSKSSNGQIWSSMNITQLMGPTSSSTQDMVLGYVNNTTQESSGTVPTNPTLVAGMTTTFNTTVPNQRVAVSASIGYAGSHDNRIGVYLDNALIIPNSASILLSDNDPARWWMQPTTIITVPSPGSHTIEVRWAAKDATTAMTFYERSLSVINTLATGGGGAAALKNPYTLKRKTDGNVSVTSTSYTAIDPAQDITLRASVGDVLMLGLMGRVNVGGYLLFDVGSVVGGTLTNRYGGGLSDGVPSGLRSSGGDMGINIMVPWTVQASDLAADGTITIRWYAKAASNSSTINAAAAVPLDLWAINSSLSGGGSGTVDSWHVVGTAGEPAFQNSASNYDATTLNSASFRKEGVDVVRLKGTVNATTGSAMFTLPVGYRPLKLTSLKTGQFATVGGTSVDPFIQIYPDGRVILGNATSGTTPASLDGLTFTTT